MKFKFIFILAVLMAFMAAGCAVEVPEVVVEEAESPYAGSSAYDFTLETYEGEVHTLSDYRGRVVVMNFWYST